MSASALVATPSKAQHENRLEDKLIALSQPKLLVLDEIGYLPLDQAGATRKTEIKTNDQKTKPGAPMRTL